MLQLADERGGVRGGQVVKGYAKGFERHAVEIGFNDATATREAGNGTLLGFVIAHLIVALPFSIITISGALETFDPAIEDAASDADLLYPYVAVAQVYAYLCSLSLGLSPDNPNRQGTVNRVVQGVRLYPLEA